MESSGSGYRPNPAFTAAAESANEAQRQFIKEHPGHLPEAQLVAGNCAELGPILRGEKDAVQVLFAGAGAELLDQFYGDGLLTSHWLAAITAAVQEAARALPEGRGLRILEVGAGTGGLSAQVLPALERGLHSYTFTDVSAAFFPGAHQKLANFPEVETRIFDLEKSATEQGFELGSFDFIIGTNVLHAVADIRAALRNLYELLAPGGSLVFMDVATPQLWTEAVFGLTSGWWRFSDRDLRPVHPLLGRSQWETVLRETGFNETASLPGLMRPQGEGQIAHSRAQSVAGSARPRARGGSSAGKIMAYFCRPGRHWFLLSRTPARGRYSLPNCLPWNRVRSERYRYLHAKSRSAGRLAPTFRGVRRRSRAGADHLSLEP